MKRTIISMLLLTTLLFTACDTTPADTSDTTAAETTAPETVPDTTVEDTTEAAKPIYYLRTPEQPPEKTKITYPVYEFDSYDEAVAKARDREIAATGYAVYSEDGEFLFGLNNEYVTNMLYRAKYIADFAREFNYSYGSAARNPAVTFHDFLKRGNRPKEKIVSCDRYVGWVLYEMGYTDQPDDSGMFVWGNSNNRDHNLMIYLEKHGYKRIDDTSRFMAGDIVFVRPTTSSGGEPYGAHVFICAGRASSGFYRYDHGSDARIKGAQPSREGISELFCVYRPTQTTMAEVPENP